MIVTVKCVGNHATVDIEIDTYIHKYKMVLFLLIKLKVKTSKNNESNYYKLLTSQ